MTIPDSSHNPYDFANPVSTENLFVGRTQELAEIKYYLDHAKKSPRPINIALLGPRASGKTSLLNMCEILARERGFCTVRINLDEGDVRSELAFFFKLFDGIFTAACDLGAFEGKLGKTYDAYLDIVNAYSIPEDKTFCPFLFPLQYARAMAAGNTNAALSDSSYMTDLGRIRTELQRPILILFDEGNVLANSRVYLEKLRNIFMNNPGFMLLMTGTPDLFPVIDDVFSPIIRQFKKIRIDGFKNLDETRECVRRPLEAGGLKSNDVFPFSDIREIHDLSAGRPYEIQLICHILFRNVQEKRSKRMKINLDALEAVRRELETSQDISTRPILAKIKSLEKDDLAALSLLCICDGRASLDQIWAIQYTFKGPRPWNKTILKLKLRKLRGEGIVKEEGGLIKFVGDEFDKIYTKYFARERQVQLALPVMFPDFTPEVLLTFQLFTFFEKLPVGLTATTAGTKRLELAEIARRVNEDDDLFSRDASVIEEAYPLMIRYRRLGHVPMLRLTFAYEWGTIHSWLHSDKPLDQRTLQKCVKKIGALSKRASRVGGSVEFQRVKVKVPPVDRLIQRVETTTNLARKHQLAAFHVSRMMQVYFDNPKEALFHAGIAYRYNPDLTASEINNLGYVFMAAGDLRRSREMLKQATELYKEGRDKALPVYNLGILGAKRGNFRRALSLLDEAIKYLADTGETDQQCLCLFVPQVQRGKLTFSEVRDPYLLQTCHSAKEVLEAFLKTRTLVRVTH